MVEIVSINTILQQYQTIFLIHKIQDVVLDDVSLLCVMKILVIIVVEMSQNVIFYKTLLLLPQN